MIRRWRAAGRVECGWCRIRQSIGIKTLEDPLPIDTTDNSPMAELAVALLALFAHVERVFMRERAAHARDIVATHGKQPGRPRKLDLHQLAAARAALAANQTVEQVAAAFGVSRATLYRHLTEHNSPLTSTNPLICGW